MDTKDTHKHDLENTVRWLDTVFNQRGYAILAFDNPGPIIPALLLVPVIFTFLFVISVGG